jgi:hypothetical protein
MKQNFNPEMWLVERREFNPGQWLTMATNQKIPSGKQKNTSHITKGNTTITARHEIEVITRRIEANGIDLTANYNDWLNVGFALADEFGEFGRDYFHRLSLLNSGYKSDECNIQFDKCLKSNKKGITIKTVFYLAKEAGVNLRV